MTCDECGLSFRSVSRHKAHAHKPVVIDTIAIERRIDGEPVPLNTPELVEAVRLMAHQGRGDSIISQRLRVSGTRINEILARAS
jgi:hypothetical protein